MKLNGPTIIKKVISPTINNKKVVSPRTRIHEAPVKELLLPVGVNPSLN
jgi:hypothetical protein